MICRIAVVVCALALGFVACASNGPSETELAVPQWVCPVPPTDTTGGDDAGFGGIGARPGSQAIYLNWIIGDERDLVAYQIYRLAPDVPIYRRDTTLALTADQINHRRGSVIEYQDLNVERGAQYQYVLFAMDAETRLSEPSVPLSYGLMVTPSLDAPLNNSQIQDPKPLLVFTAIGMNTDLRTYVARVEKEVGSAWEVMWVGDRATFDGFGTNQQTGAPYGEGGYVREAELSPGSYRWRIDFQGATPGIPADIPCECAYDTLRCPDPSSALPKLGEFSQAGSASDWWYFTVVQ